MEGKKISFGFLKTKTLKNQNDNEKKDYIDCVEEKSIKIIGVEKEEEIAPLVIPMKPNTLVTAERLKQIADEVEKSIEEDLVKTTNNDTEKSSPMENESIDQMAVRELLQDAKKEKKIDAPVLTLPVTDKLILDGQKESTLEDYESVPIQDFGMAMLRGMGWTPGNEQSKYKQPQLRPKGLGLGADKVVKENQKKNSANNKDEELSIVKNSFVKIVVGKYNGCYGKVVSLDEENGRVMVEISVKKETVSLSEFMMQPVSKSEFEKQSRVINADKYEEYKKNEASSSQKPNYKDRDHNKDNKSQNVYEKSSSNGKKKSKDRRRNSSSSEERSKRRIEKKKYSSNESLSSISESEKRKNYKKDRIRGSSINSDSSDYSKKYKKNKSRNRSRTPEMKRDIDKKRKGKKKRRDRDRSPSYRKHKSKN